MNGHELWRLRELGFGGSQVQKQEANFWSKHNCPVIQSASENPRHGFGNAETLSNRKSAFAAAIENGAGRNRITLPVVVRDSTRFRPPSPTYEPPRKQVRFSSPISEVQGSTLRPSPTDISSAMTSKVQSIDRSKHDKSNWYFLSSGESLRDSYSSALPQLAQEHHVDLGHSNKIFAAHWLSDNRIVMGTKCNTILVMDADKRKPKYNQPRIHNILEDEEDEETTSASSRSSYNPSTSLMRIHPLKSSSDMFQLEQNCGIHAIDVNPSGTLFASGGDNPADVSIFRLPNFEPLTVGEGAHNDWLFDLEWLDDEYLVSGSRDSTLALWRFPDNQEDIIVCSHSNRLVKSRNGPVSGGYVGNHRNSSGMCYYGCYSYPASRPIAVKKLQRFDKVRALSYNHAREALASVSLNSCLQVLDIKTFKQRLLRRLDGYTECVCLCNSPDDDLLTIGSRTSFAFYDTRTWERVADEKLPRRIDEDPHSVQSMMPSGVRSVSWRGSMLTLGTGGGEIMFYDVRARKFLQCDCNRSLTLKISGGWLQQDEVYQEIFLNLPCPNAVYAHCYDEYGTRLFAAGGPIAASLVGNYAAMWD